MIGSYNFNLNYPA